jgi:hypothetical protein
MVTVIGARLGLGDSITLAGAMVELARQYEGARVPAVPRYMESVRSFYVDHPEIEVYPVEGEPPLEAFEVVGKALRIGHYGARVEGIMTTPEFNYAQLGIPYRHRWDSCPIEKAAQKVEQLEWINRGGDMVFLHDDPTRGLIITRGRPRDCYRPVDCGGSILRYCTLISHAREVHVIDSSFLHLTESIETCGALYLHGYAKTRTPDNNPGDVRLIQPSWPTRKEWKILS